MAGRFTRARVSAVTHTRTYATCDVVIHGIAYEDDYVIYAQDFSFDTKKNKIDIGLHPVVKMHLDGDHVRIFDSMNKFTMWLFEIGAVVDKCWFV